MGDEVADLLAEAGQALEDKNLEEAEALYQKVLELNEEGQHLVEQGIALQNLGRIYKKQDRMDDAVEKCELAISILDAALGPQTINLYQAMHERHRVQAQMASALSTLAGIRRSRNELDAAEALLRRALQVTEAALGADHNQMATCYNNLGMLLTVQGRLYEAEPLIRRAVEVMRGAVGLYHASCSKLINNVAAVLEQQVGHYEISGPDTDEPDNSINGRRTEASNLRALAQMISEGKSSKKDMLVTEARLHNESADVYLDSGLLEQAEQLLTMSVKLVERAHGENDYRVAVMLTNLAVVHQAYSPPNCPHPHPKVAAAEGLLRRALGIATAAYGSRHIETGQRAENLATYYLSQGRPLEAEPLLEASVMISEEYLEELEGAPPDQRQLAKLGSRQDKLGRVKLQQGKAEAAETLLNKALENLQEALGPVHPDVGYCIYNLAELNRAFGREDEAKALTKHALEIQELANEPEK